jgi:hypothetical protein
MRTLIPQEHYIFLRKTYLDWQDTDNPIVNIVFGVRGSDTILIIKIPQSVWIAAYEQKMAEELPKLEELAKNAKLTCNIDVNYIGSEGLNWEQAYKDLRSKV